MVTIHDRSILIFSMHRFGVRVVVFNVTFNNWRGVLDTTLCDKVYQWLAIGWWFSRFPQPIKLIGLIYLLCLMPQYFSYIKVTSFSGGRSRSTRREPPTIGKQLVNFITCGCKSSAPFFVIYKAGCDILFFM
jgi:hypothetical protein